MSLNASELQSYAPRRVWNWGKRDALLIQGMTGAHGYQWFLPTWLAQQEYRDRQWYNTEHYNKYHNESVNCTVSQMRKALEGYMSLHPKSYADDNAIMQENRTVGDWKALYKQVATAQGKEDSEYGGYAYDAVWVFALALEALFQRNHSHTSTLHDDRTFQELISLINETNFNGVSGHVRFYKSSRLTDVLIKQWVNGTQVHVGTYNPGYGDDSDKLLLGPQGPMKPIFWPSGSNPGDGSEDPATCPLEGLRSLLGTSCDLAIVVANVIGLGLFALIMIGGCIIFKQRYEKRVKQTEARMRELGLLSSNNVLSLDGWEMPRDYIVINRKLGEGAFGTVYGGEAFVPDKGWVAVAVKTLKVGAIVEEKLDFLSEAEMMKRFDHKNIVRLLGVCTSGEPVYTVMEFMLYGDLKTYLLARRHLVKETNRNDSEEVSDKCLTAMALDVARGLSYLADLKYVHRDLACRNCLVNAGRTVKIGDFGMCRPMYDSDYYRFNKRGMLPVRWMAPESLIDGIFTTMSDVWSYGVLLYEIVTFASFPYQGLSNNQVLDFVKNFNTLPVPNGCKPELEALLFRCWTRCAQQRPTACEIVEILANDSSLISPCLDLPLASVQVEGTDSLELTSIGDRNRLHSISSLGRKAEPPPPLPLNDTNRAPLVNAAVQQPGSPSDLPRNQYVTLRQSFRSTGQVDGFAQCSAQNMTSL
ncbi:atrial natriuretic peptide receptor 2 [Ixodes scapularis]